MKLRIYISFLLCLLILSAFSIIYLPGISHASSGGSYTWVWQNPLPLGHVMYSTSSIPTANRVWSVGEYGVILYWNGSTLTEQSSGTTNNLYGVCALDASHVWAVGEAGTILFYDGVSWTAQTSPVKVDLFSVSAADSTHVWAVGSYDGFRNINILFFDGLSWSVQYHEDYNPAGGFMDVFALNSTNVWAVGRSTYFYDGSAWTEINTDYAPMAIHASAPNNVWAVDWDGTVLSSNDGGRTWTARFTDYWPASVATRGTNYVWVVGWDGKIRFWDGSSWAYQTSNTTRDIYDVAARTTTAIFSAGNWYFGTSTGGTTWTSMNGGTTATLRGVSSINQDRVWAVGTSGTIVYSADGGNVWTAQNSATTNDLYGVSALDATHVWAVGAKGTISFYNGSSWGGQTSGITSALYGVSALDATHVWAVGASGRIRFYNGSSWGAQYSGITSALYGVSALDATHVWAVGASGRIMFYNGSKWGAQYTIITYPLYGVSALDDKHVWAVGAGGTIMFYDGSSWGVQTSPTGQTLYGVTAVDATHVWAVGTNGTILFFDGSRWTQQASDMTTNALYGVYGYDANNVWAVGASGTILFADPPYIKVVAPKYGKPNSTTSVEVVGGYTHFDSTSKIGAGDGVSVVPGTMQVIDNTHILVDFEIQANARLGPRDVNVVTGDEIPIPLSGGFVVGEEPQIASVSPVSAPRGWKGDVKIEGSNTNFSSKSVASFGDGISINGTVSVSAEEMIVNISVAENAACGARSVNVTTDGEKPKPLSNGFTVLYPPNVSSVSPERGTTGSIVTIKGENFGSCRGNGDGKPASTVEFSGVPVVNYIEWSDAEIKCEVPGGIDIGPVVVRTLNGSSNEDIIFSPLSTVWYLAEGSEGWGFDTEISIINPNSKPAKVLITYMTPEGSVNRPYMDISPMARVTLDPASDGMAGKDFSTKVECVNGLEIAASRTMFWKRDSSRYEGHSSIGVVSPARTWYLPEGSSSWGFECWLLVQNPNDEPASISITYMIEGASPVTVNKQVNGKSRATFNMASDIGSADASILVESNIPVVAERAMYRYSRSEGHSSVGVTSPSKDFYLAEGCTGWGFKTYILIQNPQGEKNEAQITFQTQGGEVKHAPLTLEPLSRKTICVNDILPDSDFSTHVTSNLPIVAERAMYWIGEAGESCHDSIGMSSSFRVFYLPAGESGEILGKKFETWTLVSNPEEVPVDVKVSYLTCEGLKNKSFTVRIPAGTRYSFPMGEYIKDDYAGVVVECLTGGRKIVAESSTYWDGRSGGISSIGGYAN